MLSRQQNDHIFPDAQRISSRTNNGCYITPVAYLTNTCPNCKQEYTGRCRNKDCYGKAKQDDEDKKQKKEEYKKKKAEEKQKKKEAKKNKS